MNRVLHATSIKKRIERIEAELVRALAKDRHAIRRKLHRLGRPCRRDQDRKSVRHRLNRIDRQLRASVAERVWRQSHCPHPVDIDTLPITACKNAIIDAIGASDVVIVSGETGSGKSTQLPKFCLAAGRGIDGKIGCTQPRRIAATSLAARIAEELGEPPGRSVGHKIRFQDRSSRRGFIKVMTDGILLAETQRDPLLTDYDTLIVDEAHERSLNIDFVLGILKGLLPKRRDLKVVITSATIDTDKFARSFDGAPVIEVSGRMYPVDIRYVAEDPAAGDFKQQNAEDLNPVDMAVAAVEHVVARTQTGDILVFMPTEQDIRDTCELLAGRRLAHTLTLPLFARLSGSDQARIFRPTSQRKIIVATNIAETSLTIPGIQVVVDSGLARMARYNPRARTNQLPVVPISRSSADQRAGRCGRTADGLCIRLYAEADYVARPLYTEPEILRSNLADVVLRMLALNLGDIEAFPFIDPPAEKRISDGIDVLNELGAVRVPKKRPKKAHPPLRLTSKGRLMARIPIDPRLSCMLLEADQRGCLNSVAVIAAALSIQDPRERPHEKAADADRAHAGFHHPASDFITLLNLWHHYQRHGRRAQSRNQVRKFCRDHFLSYRRMREWSDIYHQIRQLLAELDMSCGDEVCNNPQESDHAKIHQSILSGFLSNIAVKKEKNILQAAKGRQAMVFPGSALFNKVGNWVVAAEMVETSRLFARTVANIDPEWIEPIAKHHCKYTYLKPHWDAAKEEVMAEEQVSLYGLIITHRRPVPYGRIDPSKATELFVRGALVEMNTRQRLPFMTHNRKLIDDLADVEERTRRRDILVGEDAIVQFYLDRLDGVYNFKLLAQKISEAGSDRFLRLQPDDLLLQSPPPQVYERFPDRIKLGDVAVQCQYAFQPGCDDDGVTVKIPESKVSAAVADDVDWLVPGLLEEKITALIKGLPKSYRKKLLPLSETAGRIAAGIRPQRGRLINALSDHIHRHFGVRIPATAWPETDLPDHLRMRISITDPHGLEIRTTRDKAALQHPGPSPSSPDELQDARRNWERTGLTRWDFGDLPDHVELKLKNGTRWTFYPGLYAAADDARRVDYRLFDKPATVRKQHPKGVARLLAGQLGADIKHLKKSLRLPAELHAAAVYIGGAKRVEANLYRLVSRRLLERDIRTRSAFDAYLNTVAPLLLPEATTVMKQMIPVLGAIAEAREAMARLKTANPRNTAVAAFIDERIDGLMQLAPDNFMLLYDPESWPELQRYIKARVVRCQRAVTNLEKDRLKAQKVQPYQAALTQLATSLSPADSDLKRRTVEELFWLVEEYKISVYAPEIKTAGPVSEKRLDEVLERLAEMT